MLDLQARVHLHEPDAVGAQPGARIGDELDGAGADIADGLRGLHGDAHSAARVAASMLTSGTRRSASARSARSGTPKAEAQHAPGLAGIDDAVVPQPRGGVIGMPLGSYCARIGALNASSSSALQVSPAPRYCRAHVASTLAACSPPITEMRAFGHMNRKRGE
jgi:hypothetical protein